LHGLSATGGDRLYATRETAHFSKSALPRPCTFSGIMPRTPQYAHARARIQRTRTRSHYARELLLQRFLFLSALPRPCTFSGTPLPAVGRGVRGPREKSSLPWMDGTPPAYDHWLRLLAWAVFWQGWGEPAVGLLATVGDEQIGAGASCGPVPVFWLLQRSVSLTWVLYMRKRVVREEGPNSTKVRQSQLLLRPVL
jgi:hypothetical protein